MTPRSLPPLALASALLLVGLAACAHGGRSEHRYFQPDASQMGPEPNSYGEVVLPRHALIAVQGDGFAYGQARGHARYRINGAQTGQSPITLSETLRRSVKGVKVENRGLPGDTVAASAVRWAHAAPADLTILCLGYGDAAAQTDQGQYGAALKALILQDEARGGAVFLVVPPQPTDRLLASRTAPYREIARGVGRSSGAVVFDAGDSLSRAKATPSRTEAQSPEVYQAVAADMAPYIRVVDAPALAHAPPPAPDPQAGQSGSAVSPTVRASPASPS